MRFRVANANRAVFLLLTGFPGLFQGVEASAGLCAVLLNMTSNTFVPFATAHYCYAIAVRKMFFA